MGDGVSRERIDAGIVGESGESKRGEEEERWKRRGR